MADVYFKKQDIFALIRRVYSHDHRVLHIGFHKPCFVYGSYFPADKEAKYWTLVLWKKMNLFITGWGA